MNVAVLWLSVHVPAGPLTVPSYWNVVGFESVYETGLKVPAGAAGSVTVTLPSTIVVGAPNAPDFVPLASPLVIEQLPPLSIASLTPVRVTDSQSFGFVTVIVPVTVQPLSLPPL